MFLRYPHQRKQKTFEHLLPFHTAEEYNRVSRLGKWIYVLLSLRSHRLVFASLSRSLFMKSYFFMTLASVASKVRMWSLFLLMTNRCLCIYQVKGEAYNDVKLCFVPIWSSVRSCSCSVRVILVRGWGTMVKEWRYVNWGLFICVLFLR